MLLLKFWFIASLMNNTFSIPIFSVNSLFEVFSPISLVRFFEFSDQGWNISEGCIKDMYVYLDGLQTDKLWAMKCKYFLFYFYTRKKCC